MWSSTCASKADEWNQGSGRNATGAGNGTVTLRVAASERCGGALETHQYLFPSVDKRFTTTGTEMLLPFCCALRYQRFELHQRS
jgi:hypothetical protein